MASQNISEVLIHVLQEGGSINLDLNALSHSCMPLENMCEFFPRGRGPIFPHIFQFITKNIELYLKTKKAPKTLKMQ